MLGKSARSGGFSLDAVAAKAGVTRLTVYNHFGSRRALLETVFDELAVKGGLNDIPQAMADPDPHAGLMRLIAIFCDFWAANRATIGRLAAVGRDDPELEESLRDRNERRRRALSVLVGRMAQRSHASALATDDVVDILFALTGFQFYTELQRGTRPSAEVSKLIRILAEELLQAGDSKS